MYYFSSVERIIFTIKCHNILWNIHQNDPELINYLMEEGVVAFVDWEKFHEMPTPSFDDLDRIECLRAFSIFS